MTVSLIDENGRCIPTNNKGKVVDPNPPYYPQMGGTSTEDAYQRLRRFFPQEKLVTSEEFIAQVAKLTQQLQQDERVHNLLSSMWVPICLPQIGPSSTYRGMLTRKFLPAATASCQEAHPRMKFRHPLARTRLGDIKIVDAHHAQLVEMMRKKPVVGLWFANPLQGFSIRAARAQIHTLPQDVGMFCLGGAFEAATALVASPRILLGDDALCYGAAAVTVAGTNQFSPTFNAGYGIIAVERLGLKANGSYSASIFFAEQS